MEKLYYKIYSILILTLLALCIKANAQCVVRNPQFSRNDSWALHIDSIMYICDTTKLFCTFYSEGYGSWANINNNTYIRETKTGEKHKILRVEGLPMSPNRKEWGVYDPYSITVVLVFDQISNNSVFDLIEIENSNTAFNVYEINPNKQNTSLDIDFKTKWQTLENSSDFYYQCENYKTTIEKCLQLLPYSRSLYGEKSENALYTYIKLTLSNYFEGRFDDVITYGIEASNICEYSGNKDAYQLFLSPLSIAFQKLGKYEEAIIYIKKELEIKESSPTPDPLAILYVKDDLFISLCANGNDEEAIKYGEESILAHKTLAIENDTTFIPVLQCMAALYSDYEEHKKSIDTYDELLALYTTLGKDKNDQYAGALDLQANEYYELKNYKTAIKKKLSALEILKEVNAPKSDCYKSVLIGLSSLYKSVSDYKKSKLMSEEYREFCKNNYGENSEEYLNSLSFCINLYVNMNHIGIAHDYAIIEREIAKKVYGTQSIQYRKALDDLESCYVMMGDKTRQKEIKDEMANVNTSISINHDNSNRFDVENWVQYYNISTDYFNANPDSFLYYIQKCLKLTEGHPDAKKERVSGLFLIACHYCKAPDISMKYLDEAITIQKEIDDKCEDMVMLKALYNLEESIASGDTRKIKWEIQQEFWLYIRQRIIENFFYMSEIERAAYWDYKRTFFINPIAWSEIANEKNDYTYIEHMYDYCLFMKSLLLTTSKNIEEAVNNSNDLELKNKFAEIKLLRGDISEEEIASKEKEIVAHSTLYEDYKERLNTKWQDVRDALSDNEIAMEFFRHVDNDGNDEFSVFILRKNWEHPKTEFIGYVTHIIETQDMDAIMPAWNLLIKTANIKPGETIYLSVDGSLHKYGFEHVKDDKGEYLSDIYNFVRLTSTREIIDKSNKSEINEVALFGGLDYNANIEELSKANEKYTNANINVDSEQLRSATLRSGFEELPNSYHEVTQIDKLLINKSIKSRTFVKSQGTEEAFKSISNSNYNIIHLATHGGYLSQEEGDSIRNQNNYSFIDVDGTAGFLGYDTSSMTRSFVVMAGGNMLPKHIDIPSGLCDGILTAKEISNLDMKNVDLVVLSSCKSGMGDISNEGVLGLQYGFKKAGVKSILMSLDNVDDKATQLLMVEFYKNLLSGKSKHESLRNAQRYLRSIENGKYNDPKYWASFVLLDGIN